VRVIVVNRFATVAGGAEKHAVGLARLLRSRGHEVRFLSTISSDNAELEGAFVPLAGSNFWRGQPAASERVAVAAVALWNRRAAHAMRDLIDRFEPDIVHVHDIYPQLSVAPVVESSRRGVPVVQTLHNYELMSASPIDHLGGRLDRGDAARSVRWLRTALWALRRTLHVPRVTSWVAVSRFVAERYASHRIGAEVLENFIDPAPPGGAPGFEERSGIVFVGRLAPEKGVRDVLTLAGALPEVPVHVIGRGSLDGEVEEAARTLSNLTFLGELPGDEVDARIAGARLVVVPSRWQEPAGLVALEAMARGTPVVAYATGGLAGYVREAGAGRVVPVSAGALTAAARDLYDDRGSWAGFSGSGLEAALTTHSPERYLTRLEDLYERAAQAAGPATARRSNRS
jgi:glycosyltransferase involved in cell wall biosynthesis